MQAPDTILKLVERFEENIDQYRSPHYNEAQLRTEFANPFFIALGWDVFNEKGYAEAYKEVVHEAVVKVGGATKAPDYSFRIGGNRKFFVETKKPAVNLNIDPLPAFQLRRYAWSAKLPLSILTDFEEFAVYDTRIKPAKNDKASLGRIINLTYRDYTDRWEEIADIFSPTAISKGSFDRYVETTRGKKGTAEVDDAFLKEIESWRDELARNIALRNPGLSTRELNFAVQRIIDRIIFLRICEDRGIEEYGELSALLSEKEIYPRLVALFNRADERYNSGLFHFQKERHRPEPPDTLTPTLKIDDRVPREIIKDLYYPESPYEFSVLPADILGQVYEQFLGKVIRLTPGHRAVVEEKPEVKKAGGVYYTPTYIVDYIVENTVGKLLSGKTPRQVSGLRILDPACGSGSFLIGAYQRLLDWHLEYYQNDGGFEKWRKELYEGPGGAYRLTTAERRRILLNNIYGVDIDPQAVEVTKLSLLLKVLEGESGETLNRQLEIFRERALPDLASNIKCGNSLIGPDFYQGKQMSLLSDEERLRINPFDWGAEFKEIMEPRPASGGAKAGFDAVIGNPPYVNAINLVELFEAERNYLCNSKKYSTLFQKWDLYIAFIEKSLRLLKRNGYASMIIPYPFLSQTYAKLLREYIINNFNLETIVDLSSVKVFKDATVKNCIYVISNKKASNSVFIYTIDEFKNFKKVTVKNYDELVPDIKNLVWDAKVSRKLDLIKMSYKTLGDLSFISIGMVLNAHELKAKGKFKKKDLISEKPTKIHVKKYVEAKDIDKYIINRIRWLEWNTSRVPSLIRRPTFPELYERDKILVTKIGDIKAVLDEEKLYCDQTIRIIILWKNLIGVENKSINNSIKKYYNAPREILENNSEGYDEKFLLGILNSKVANYLLNQIRGIGNIDINPEYLKNIKIPSIDFSDANDIARHDRMVSVVEDMLSLHKKLAPPEAGRGTDHERNALKRQIDATDRQIDKLVYELYGLTEEEIKVVEG